MTSVEDFDRYLIEDDMDVEYEDENEPRLDAYLKPDIWKLNIECDSFENLSEDEDRFIRIFRRIKYTGQVAITNLIQVMYIGKENHMG